MDVLCQFGHPASYYICARKVQKAGVFRHGRLNGGLEQRLGKKDNLGGLRNNQWMTLNRDEIRCLIDATLVKVVGIRYRMLYS